ncbi:MAG: alpha/beta hydrolase [Patescibacteria group bacterium]|nr:alpha/beta hydrolase [Patescibacteria group bacterium]
MKNALILHGADSNSKANWFPWLKLELEKRGYRVFAPNLPHSEVPDIKQYKDCILSSGFSFGAKTILVGHSAGSVIILKLLETLPENVDTAILVGAFKDSRAWFKVLFGKPVTLEELRIRVNAGRELMKNHIHINLRKLFAKPFKFEKIKKRARKIIFIHSDDDPFCPLSGAKYLARKVGGELIVLPGQKHFSVSTAGKEYIRFPFLLELLDGITRKAVTAPSRHPSRSRSLRSRSWLRPKPKARR